MADGRCGLVAARFQADPRFIIIRGIDGQPGDRESDMILRRFTGRLMTLHSK